jgi:hypothetical protein
MSSFYRLQIHGDAEQKQAVERLLGNSTDDPALDWGWVIEEDSYRFPHAIPLFLDVITRYGDALAQLGLSAERITVWYCYEYDQQCNMEFGPALLKRMGELEVTLCISCWAK